MPRKNKLTFRSGSAAPSASDFAAGEPAWDSSNGKLYVKNAAGAMVEVGAAYVFEYATTANFPTAGQSTARIYVATDTGRVYRWTGTEYQELGAVSAYDSRWDLFLPAAPTGLSGTSGDAQVSLTWTAPTVSSQTPVTDYVIQYSSNNGSAWSTFSDGASSNASAVVTGLTNNTAYIFRVAAVNGVGQGAWSSTSASVTPAVTVSVTYLLVAGGGGGGSGRGGGGGAGGVLNGTGNASGGQALAVTVGSGGAAGSNGGNSTFPLTSGTITAIGGGKGADGLAGLFTGSGAAGGSGGSGGGGSGYSPVGSGGTATSGQGNAGGSGYGGGEPYGGGGGGGAGTAGGSGGAVNNGGAGTSSVSAILAATSAGVDSGGTRYIAGGGGNGSYEYSPGSGGLGGGGGGGNTNVAGTAGTANTGGGGGGGGNSASGGAGGSGLVIIRVADSITATATTGSPTVYVTGGYRYYKFTASGSITF